MNDVIPNDDKNGIREIEEKMYKQKLVIYSLEAKIRDLLDENITAKALVAERALNRLANDK